MRHLQRGSATEIFNRILKRSPCSLQSRAFIAFREEVLQLYRRSERSVPRAKIREISVEKFQTEITASIQAQITGKRSERPRTTEITAGGEYEHHPVCSVSSNCSDVHRTFRGRGRGRPLRGRFIGRHYSYSGRNNFRGKVRCFLCLKEGYIVVVSV